MSAGTSNRIVWFINGLVERLLARPARLLYRKWLRLQYAHFPSGHEFQVVIDDLEYKMSFGNHPIGNAIVQRIRGRREPETMAVYRSLIRPGDKVVEIGACYGEFSIVMAQCAGDHGKVVAIEGTPNNFALLRQNLQANNVTNVDAYNLFIASTGGDVRFGAADTHPYNAIAALKDRAGEQHGSNEVAVRAVRLTEFLNSIEFVPDLIFMDIEGFELDVFEDFFETEYLSVYRPTILFEVHPQFYEAHRDLKFVEAGLAKAGYGWRRIAANKLCFPLKNQSDRSDGQHD